MPLRSNPEPSTVAQNQSEFKPLDFRMGNTSATGSLMDLDANEFFAETGGKAHAVVFDDAMTSGVC